MRIALLSLAAAIWAAACVPASIDGTRTGGGGSPGDRPAGGDDASAPPPGAPVDPGATDAALPDVPPASDRPLDGGADAASDPPADPPAADAKPADGPPGDGKPEDAAATDVKPPDAKAADAPPAAGEADLVYCVDETNRYRAMVAAPPLGRSAGLEAYAAEGARLDGTSHTPHGHFISTGGGGVAFAENEIPWWKLKSGPTVRDIIRKGLALMWAEGPGGGHYENIIGPYLELGCGVFVSGAGEVTVVQDFR